MQALQFQASRCYYAAHAYLIGGNPQAAYALFLRVTPRADAAISQHEDCSRVDQEACDKLEGLKTAAQVWQCVAQVGPGLPALTNTLGKTADLLCGCDNTRLFCNGAGRAGRSKLQVWLSLMGDALTCKLASCCALVFPVATLTARNRGNMQANCKIAQPLAMGLHFVKHSQPQMVMHCACVDVQADCAAEQQQHIEETGGKVEQLSLEQAPSKGVMLIAVCPSRAAILGPCKSCSRVPLQSTDLGFV